MSHNLSIVDVWYLVACCGWTCLWLDISLDGWLLGALTKFLSRKPFKKNLYRSGDQKHFQGEIKVLQKIGEFMGIEEWVTGSRVTPSSLMIRVFQVDGGRTLRLKVHKFISSPPSGQDVFFFVGEIPSQNGQYQQKLSKTLTVKFKGMLLARKRSKLIMWFCLLC